MSDRQVAIPTGAELDPNATRQAAPARVAHASVACDDSKLDSENARLGLPVALTPERTTPELGPREIVGDFEIVRMLGEGGVARVYLAKQRTLDRFVALKVSEYTGDEGRTLASLEHDHIVQVFAEQVVGSRRLMAMRYVPSITLARLLDLLHDAERAGLKGGDLLALVDREVGQSPSIEDTRARGKLLESSFVRTCCQVVAGLARALEHAHGQHVLHRDIKPANILIAQSGRALLMDFNIAARNANPTRERGSADRDNTSPKRERGDTESDRRSETADSAPSLAHRASVASVPAVPSVVFGGTPAYMATEHLSAMAVNTPTNMEKVDERSDVFSLGVVFFELLTGRHPFRVIDSPTRTMAALNQMLADRLQGPPAVRSTGLEVSPGLESIIAKCLAAAPAGRYQRASELAEDLERFVDDMPLGYADDPSLRERTGKWLRRNPSWRMLLAGAAAVLALVIGFGAWTDLRRLGDAERLIAQAEEQVAQGAIPVAADTLDEANQLLAARTGVIRYFGAEEQREQLKKAVKTLAGSIAIVLRAEFDTMADSARVDPEGTALAGPSRPAAAFLDPLSVFAVLERDDWQQSASFQSLDPEDQAQIEEDVTELLVVQSLDDLVDPTQMGGFRAGMSVHMKLGKVPARHRNANAVRTVMSKINSPYYSNPAPAPVPLPAAPPGDWDVFDVYLTGVVEAKEGRDETARLYFKAAADRCADTNRPLKFWAHFQLADCLFRLDEFDPAAVEYGACIGLRGEFAWPYNNLGLVYQRQGNLAEAARQFDEALTREPRLGPARTNLSGIQIAQEQFADAEATCTKAIQMGYRTPEIFSNRGVARAALGNRTGAIQDFRAALDIDPKFEKAQENLRLLNPDPRR